MKIGKFLLAALLVCCPLLALGQSQAGPGQDFEDFLDATFSLQTLAAPPATAAWSSFVSRPPGFEAGLEGFGHHYGIALADNVSGKFIRKFAFPVVTGRRDHYDEAPQGETFMARVLHATRHTVFAQPGSRELNWSSLPGSATSAALSNLYQPVQQRTWINTLERTGTNALGYWLGDIVSEFKLKCMTGKLVTFGRMNCK